MEYRMTRPRGYTNNLLDQPNETQTLNDQYHHHQMIPQHQQGGTTTAAGHVIDLQTVLPPRPQAQPEANQAAAKLIRYQECLKNHAASVGGHVIDGCREFMPAGDEGTPDSLKCAACECHRSFHRRATQVEEQLQHLMSSFFRNGNNKILTTAYHHIQPLTSQQYLHHPHSHNQLSQHYSPPTSGPIMMAFGGDGWGAAESSNEHLLNAFHLKARGAVQLMGVQPSFCVSQKRFRTKFSKEQKDRMHEVAEQLGWKIQKQDEEQVHKLCEELGVKRQVFKVWMHNNKQAMKRKQQD